MANIDSIPPLANEISYDQPCREGIMKGAIELPDIKDLTDQLRFSPGTGHIWLGNDRMVLMHTRSMRALREELVTTIGMAATRALLTRVGYASGVQDAELAVRIRGQRSFDEFFLVGPQLHGLEGVGRVEPVSVQSDPKTGHFYGEFIWHDSWEDEVHIDSFGVTSEAACWTQIGYASGYTSAFVGRPIAFREVECRATGHTFCRIIGKPVPEWGREAADDLPYLQPHQFVNPRSFSATSQVAQGETVTVEGRPTAIASARGLVGASAGFNLVCHMLEKVAPTNASVLLLGESGVGKEVFARTLQRISSRPAGPFIAVNCAAVPEQLIEAELFGVTKGAYTGATEDRPGRFERADGGTIFLDEIGTLSLPAQGKLLRVLQEREVERLGDSKTRKIDVRVVAATNEDLRKRVEAREFRQDLFYRLNVFPIIIPPLRERRADISLLMEHFLELFTTRHGKPHSGFTQRAIGALFSYSWPGNVRELENMIERGVILAPHGEAIDISHLFTAGEPLDAELLSMAADGSLERSRRGKGISGFYERPDLSGLLDNLIDTGVSLNTVEDLLLEKAISKADGNVSEGARILGLTRPQYAYRLKRRSGGSEDGG
ncbi:sigma 54-interacting transcriptional regulator [Sphingomonadaceae bacterium G21617-S1]|uniref:sigma-54-dependent Fis family transcriptional regulator n=1 Tax=Sphingobium amiense TaxID=135719 RepID=UPI000A84EA62|nr:sigma-54-dependent Fis family transcriptional regulator [Sphingobium amiense]MCZ4344339.1 sigma 54-interacting transcriptional regulator [Sphingomonadaceae bacterium G21617-S1]